MSATNIRSCRPDIFSKNGLIIAGLLVLLMVITRPHTFSAMTHLPNASVAIFFLAGFYLRRYLLFTLFFSIAILLDYLSITVGGVSSFCVSPAYWFLIPTYAIVWQAGILFRSHYASSLNSLMMLSILAFSSASLAFIISNGSFYLISGHYAEPSWIEYLSRFKLYYPYYVISACTYIAAVSCVHVISIFIRKAFEVHIPEYKST